MLNEQASGESISENSVISVVDGPAAVDNVNIWFVLLSWFIPIAGFIVFFVKKDSSPKTAKASGITALVSFILNLIIVIVTFLIL